MYFRGKGHHRRRSREGSLFDSDDEDSWGDPLFDMEHEDRSFGSEAGGGQEEGHLLLLHLLDERCRTTAAKKAIQGGGDSLFSQCCSRLHGRGVLPPPEFLFSLDASRAAWRAAWNAAMPEELREEMGAVVPGGAGAADKRLLGVTAQSRVARSKSLSSLAGRGDGEARLRPSPSLAIEEDLCAHGATSRYQADFEEEEKLGQGGFGAVFKVTNGLDKRQYAVKKIRFRRVRRISKLPVKVLREVRCLARLDHPNVVRYYGAWMEYSEVPSNQPPTPTHDRCESDERSDTLSALPLSEDSATTTPSEAAAGGGGGGGATLYLEYEARLYIQMELCCCSLKHYLDRPGRDVSCLDNVHIFREILQGLEYIHAEGLIHRDLKPSNIFVTLEAASQPPASALRTDGMPHLHLAKFKIGDFGVATFIADESEQRPLSASSPCVMVDSGHDEPQLELFARPGQPPSPQAEAFSSFRRNAADSSVPIAIGGQGPSPLMIVPPSPSVSFMNEHARSLATSHSRTTGIGTAGYASPEQLRKDVYDEKTDIYSLGIILLELYHPFVTRMERAKVIDGLRTRRLLPMAFLKKYPDVGRIILWLTEENPANRPSAAELLRCPFLERDDPISLLNRRIEDQELVISQLREQLSRLHARDSVQS